MTSLRALRAMPAPVRWATPALALLGCAGLLVGGWTGPEQIAPPAPRASAAPLCQALDKALPNEVLGHKRSDPEPASPYTAAWASSPRTVLRCGIERPDYLDNDWSARAPEVNDVQFGMGEDGHGGYWFVTTLRNAYVEVHVPKGAYPNYADPLSSLTDAIKATIPTWDS